MIRRIIVLIIGLCSIAAATDSSLTTLSEQSGFTRTGRYDEVERLCKAFASRWSGQLKCFQFGTTPEGRPMMALAASADGTTTAARARERKRPVVLMQGGIHAGEIDGKDAGFLALARSWKARQRPAPSRRSRSSSCRSSISTATSVSARGTGRISAARSKWAGAPTAQNLNLNRDYTKAEAPEMRAMLRLLDDWDPVAYADLHVTDGADFEHDVSVTVGPEEDGDPASRRLRPPCAMNSAGASTSKARSRSITIRPSTATTIRRRGSPAADIAALFKRLLGIEEPHRAPARDAFLEGLSDPCAHHAQLHRRPPRTRRRARR